MPFGDHIQPCKGAEILYQDDWYLVVCKDANLLTHPSFQGETDSLITRLSSYTLHPVSRLDRNTAGLILLAKNGFAHAAFLDSAAEAVKVYQGFQYLCAGAKPAESAQTGARPFPSGPDPSEPTYPREERYDAPIRRKKGSVIMRETGENGAAALTLCQEMERYGDFARKCRFILGSGRTHQIRVHCQAYGRALIGDTLYPPSPAEMEELSGRLGGAAFQELLSAAGSLGHQALQACGLSFIHPFTHEKLSFHVPLRPELQELERRLSRLAAARRQHFSGKLEG